MFLLIYLHSIQTTAKTFIVLFSVCFAQNFGTNREKDD